MAIEFYRIATKNTSFDMMHYRYNEKERLFHILKSVPSQSADSKRTEDSVIQDWTEFAADALKGKFKEHSMECWVGHYEQFGRVMLHLANMSLAKQCALGFSQSFIENILLDDESISAIYDGPSGTEERCYYRCWFSLIGHPGFLRESVTGMEAIKYSYTKFVLNIALQDLDLKRRRNLI